MKKTNVNTFQGMILKLQHYWADQNCTIMQPLDIEVGAGTSHPITYLQAIGPEPISIAYVQPSRRPTDGRYAKNPHRLQHYYQFQVMLKPAPKNIQDLYLNSLKILNIDLKNEDIRFLEDNWENPTLGASGVGWEIWLNGIEITQFTYFQQIGGLNCNPISGEITYGLERIAMHIQNVNNIYDLVWNNNKITKLTYGDIFKQNEIEKSHYNFKYANTNFLFKMFEEYIKEIEYLLTLKIPLPIPAYEYILKATHTFNLLEARKAISITERKRYILHIRTIAKKIAKTYYDFRKKLGFPNLLKTK